LAAFGIDNSRLVVGNLELALSERQVFAAGQRAHVTRREFDVLHALALCHGPVVARERLYEHVWGRPMPHARDRSVDTHVNHIRRRLREAAPEWDYIHTHFGHGYRLEPQRGGTR
jgi:DNA-binding response OmpR family regulator